jgi:hypothetical protein
MMLVKQHPCQTDADPGQLHSSRHSGWHPPPRHFQGGPGPLARGGWWRVIRTLKVNPLSTLGLDVRRFSGRLSSQTGIVACRPVRVSPWRVCLVPPGRCQCHRGRGTAALFTRELACPSRAYECHCRHAPCTCPASSRAYYRCHCRHRPGFANVLPPPCGQMLLPPLESFAPRCGLFFFLDGLVV